MINDGVIFVNFVVQKKARQGRAIKAQENRKK